MSISRLPFAIALLLALSLPGYAAEDVRIVGVGLIEVLELDFTPAPNPQIGNKGIVKVEAGKNPRQLLVTGLAKGTTSLIVSKQDGSIGKKLLYSVTPGDLTPTVLKIRKLLQDVEGITVEAMDGQVVIDGEVLTAADKLRVTKVASGYENVLDLTTVSKLAR